MHAEHRLHYHGLTLIISGTCAQADRTEDQTRTRRTTRGEMGRKQLVDYTNAEIKSRIPAEKKMTKIEKLIRAHKLIMKGDLSLFDKTYHQDYQSYNPRLGISNNLADDRVIYASVARLCRL